jgi:hypothetical protein
MLLLPKQCVIDACIYLWNVLYEGQICYPRVMSLGYYEPPF